jgi:hypothetical protein
MNEQPIEGIVTSAEPRCTRHEAITYHGFNEHPFGLPAHTWGGGPGSKGCLICGRSFEKGDRYLCDEGGIVHVSCDAHAEAAEIEVTR